MVGRLVEDQNMAEDSISLENMQRFSRQGEHFQCLSARLRKQHFARKPRQNPFHGRRGVLSNPVDEVELHTVEERVDIFGHIRCEVVVPSGSFLIGFDFPMRIWNSVVRASSLRDRNTILSSRFIASDVGSTFFALIVLESLRRNTSLPISRSGVNPI